MIIQNHGPIDRRTSTEAPAAQIALLELDDRVLIAVTGELDASNVEEFSDALAMAQSGRRNRHLVVDLGGVSFFDASTVGALLAAAMLAERLDSTLSIASISTFGRRVLHLLSVDELFGLGPALPLDLRPGTPAIDSPLRGLRSDGSTTKGDTDHGHGQA